MTSGSRQSIWWSVANSPGALPAVPNLPMICTVQFHLVHLASELRRHQPGRCSRQELEEYRYCFPGLLGPGPPDTQTAHELPTFV